MLPFQRTDAGYDLLDLLLLRQNLWFESSSPLRYPLLMPRWLADSATTRAALDTPVRHFGLGKIDAIQVAVNLQTQQHSYDQ